MRILVVLSLLVSLLSAEPYTCDELAAPFNCDLVKEEGYLRIDDNGDLSDSGRRLKWIRYRANRIAERASEEKDNGDQGAAPAAKPIPIILVHGGPGLPLDYIDTMKFLACYVGPDGRTFTTIFYYQMCVGDSNVDCPPENQEEAMPNLFTIDYYGRELRTVINSLYPDEGERVHLLGQSWGAVVSYTYITNHLEEATAKLWSFINANGGVPHTRTFQELIKRKHLPKLNSFYSKVLLSQNTEDPHFMEALQYYQSIYYVNFKDQPDCIARAHATMNLEVHLGLFAKCPWCDSTKPFVMLNLIPKLANIKIRTLAFYGETDICDPELLDSLAVGYGENIEKLWRMVLPQTSHMPWVENFQMFYDVVTDWLDDLEITRPIPRTFLVDYMIGEEGYRRPDFDNTHYEGQQGGVKQEL